MHSFFKQLEKGSSSEMFPPRQTPYDLDIPSRYSASYKPKTSMRLRLIAAVSFVAAVACIISLIVMVSKQNQRTSTLEHIVMTHIRKEHPLGSHVESLLTDQHLLTTDSSTEQKQGVTRDSDPEYLKSGEYDDGPTFLKDDGDRSEEDDEEEEEEYDDE